MVESPSALKNPFRPGAGHMPPYLAGRNDEQNEFLRLLRQDTILDNMVLTGLRGVGKTVLLETFKPMAMAKGWLWVGADLSESSSLTDVNLVIRLLADLSVLTSGIVTEVVERPGMGFGGESKRVEKTLDYDALSALYEKTPGLAADKLKSVLQTVWEHIKKSGRSGIVFAYDEAQNLADHPEKEQYPLSLLLDVFQSIQRKDIPFMLVLTGLPTLFPQLVEARTYAERMFRVVFLDKLNEEDCKDAIRKPTMVEGCPITFTDESVRTITSVSGGYPYFIQFICRDVYDLWIQAVTDDGPVPPVPIDAILRKLDSDFFAGRWAKATDRQRELLGIIAQLPNSDTEFTVQEIVALSKQQLKKPFSSSHVNQMLVTLCAVGLVYKNRYGKYSFAVPLFGGFIKRQLEQQT